MDEKPEFVKVIFARPALDAIVEFLNDHAPIPDGRGNLRKLIWFFDEENHMLSCTEGPIVGVAATPEVEKAKRTAPRNVWDDALEEVQRGKA